MTTQINKLRYLKDFYGKPTFIAARDTEPIGYNKLEKLYAKLENKYPDHRLCVYRGNDYYTLTGIVPKDKNIPDMNTDRQYTVDIRLKSYTHNGMGYVNGFVQRIVNVGRANIGGDDVELSDMSD